MKEIELLSPAGDFECLKAAVQNGANAVYFGADKFNARANSKNFNNQELAKAIEYAKLRKVKTHLTVNILIKNEEFKEALKVIEYVYNQGIDAVIVQDLGLAKKIIELFPNLEVHSSTQMTTYNLDGVQELERLGFNRVVLARELSINEIKNICKNSKIDIEVFIHGALCICYSGQCLMSSIIGGRSGNRGQCAGTCRLPYQLIDKNSQNVVDKGYLLSSKDVCTLEIIPELIKAGIKSFKIEGRMKSPAYVGGITAIYRKYIDLAQSGEEYKVDKADKKTLMQLFNRGGFSTGYLNGKLGKDMMYTKQPNHMGIYLGRVIGYNSNKGYVKMKLDDSVELGDSIAVKKSSCKISELMDKNINIKIGEKGDFVTIGRINGDIKVGDEIYKTVSINLNKKIENSLFEENVKRRINCKMILKQNAPIMLNIEDETTGESIEIQSEKIIELAEKNGTSKERIVEQIKKTGNTIFEFNDISISMEEKLFIPISSINEIRREALEKLENLLKSKIKRNIKINLETINNKQKINDKIQVSVLLNKIDKGIKYSNLKNVNCIYIPFRMFLDKTIQDKINEICNNFDTYIYFPTITKLNYENIIKDSIGNILKNRIKGFVISNLSQIAIIKNYTNQKEFIANYTLNSSNNYTLLELSKYGFTKFIISPELNKDEIKELNSNMKKEVIAYGRTLLMTSEYCPIGTGIDCKGSCTRSEYLLKDRLGFEFPVYTDRISCNSLIYNSKITSINHNDLNVNSIRIDIINETESEINYIVERHLYNQKLEGKDYTNGNLNKII